MNRLINFRDFGAKPTRSGAWVVADRLYRSGHMARIDSDNVAQLHQLDFGLVADLRYSEERIADPSPWPDTWLGRVIAHDGDGDTAPHHAMFAAAAIGPEAVDRSYTDFYAALPFNPDYQPLFATALRRAADMEGRLLIHCSAGKDRTGILSALLLDTLGVDRAAITADYLLSSGAPELMALKPDLLARAKRSGHMLSNESIDTMLGVKPHYLDAAFAAIEMRCGSVARYLSAAGVDHAIQQRLRVRFLEV